MEPHVYEEMSRVENAHWWFLARREILSKVVARYVPEGGSVLDVGCGTGFVLERLKERYDVHGIDSADVAVRYCHERGLTNVRKGTLAAADLGRTFDMVMLLDVLEHIDDEAEVLRAAYERLAPGGHLLVAVPAFQFLWSAHDVAHHHKRRYTRTRLDRVVRDAGFEPVFISYFNSLVFPLVAGARAIERMLGREVGFSSWLPSPRVNGALYAVFAAEQRVLPDRHLPVGVSILCVAQKPGG